MTDTSDTTDLRAAIDRLTARLDRMEQQASASAPPAALTSRLSGAWQSLSGPQNDFLRTALTVCAVLLALVLVAALAEEVFDGLWHLADWFD